MSQMHKRKDTRHTAGGDEGRTLCGLLAPTVRRWGGEPAYSDRGLTESGVTAALPQGGAYPLQGGFELLLKRPARI